jgi:endoglucanase
MHQRLYDLTMCDGIPSQEKEVRDYMAKHLEKVAEVSYDNLGSIIAKQGTKGPKVMVAGHMDEVGFIVTTLTDEGYVKFTPAGGWWSQVMLAQTFQITLASGEKILGTIGAKAPHILTEEERKKPVEMKDMFLDIGVASKEEAIQKGIQPGLMMTPYIKTVALSNPQYLLGKAFDNRVGCAAVLDVADHFKKHPLKVELYGVGTVQEEVGLRGAQTSAYQITPDIGIAVDTTISYDFPGGSKETELGKGPAIMIKDSSMIGHKGLRDFVIDIAQKEKIPVQLTSLLRGGTDGGQMHLAKTGAPTIALCLPVRYLHTHTSMIHQEDYDHLVKLIIAIINALDEETVQRITYA